MRTDKHDLLLWFHFVQTMHKQLRKSERLTQFLIRMKRAIWKQRNFSGRTHYITRQLKVSEHLHVREGSGSHVKHFAGLHSRAFNRYI